MKAEPGDLILVKSNEPLFRLSSPGMNAIITRDEPRHPGFARQHFLCFFPLPHGHGSLRPTFGVAFTT